MPKGSCVCGAVTFEVDPPYRFFQYCHCSRCRKRTGSIHAANMAVPAGQVRFLSGEENVKTFVLSTANGWSNAFCGTCGSGMPWLVKTGRAWIVPAGAMDDDPVERPTRNVHMASKAIWEVPAASLPDFEEPVR